MKLRSLARKWYFWVFLVFAIPAIWWVWGYVVWQLDRQDLLAENRSAYLGWLKMGADQKLLEAQYKTDTYGGATPEETLRLFVEALEKRDYELAAKYFVPEERENFAKDVLKAQESGGLTGFINAYRNGRVVPPGGVGASGIYEIELFERNAEFPFGIRLIKNEFTNKWKILEQP